MSQFESQGGTQLLRVSSAVGSLYPETHVGVLAMHGVANPPHHAALEELKAKVERALRDRYEGMVREQLRRLPTLAAYETYYRRFDKSYHVRLQLESILLRGKNLPTAATLVEAMFMAELDGLLLTAGHDLDAVSGNPVLEIARGTEEYTLLRGDVQSPKAGDMMIMDDVGIISSILHGPDQRTRIQAGTTRALFTIYAPAGIPAAEVNAQLEAIAGNARVVSPGADIDELRVYPTA